MDLGATQGNGSARYGWIIDTDLIRSEARSIFLIFANNQMCKYSGWVQYILLSSFIIATCGTPNSLYTCQQQPATAHNTFLCYFAGKCDIVTNVMPTSKDSTTMTQWLDVKRIMWKGKEMARLVVLPPPSLSRCVPTHFWWFSHTDNFHQHQLMDNYWWT
jgi:hypothetical protein